MKLCRFAVLVLAALILSGTCDAAAEFKNGTAFALGNVPKELVVERRTGEPLRFSLRGESVDRIRVGGRVQHERVRNRA